MVEEKPANPMYLRTKVNASFEYAGAADPATQASLDALNKHAEDICESLQPVFRSLIITMLELKRQTHT